MHEDAFTLEAARRDRVGSRYAKRLRDAGKLPAVVYGHKQEPVPVALDARETIKHIHDGERVFRVAIDGGEPEFALVKELQFDYLGTGIVHVDLARVDLDERVQVSLPIHLVGEARGLKEPGAVLTHPLSELDVECSVGNLPEYLEIDVSGLDAGESMSASEVPMHPGMTLLTDPESTVAQISIQYAEAEDEEAQAEPGAGEPEVITEKKDEEEAAG